MVIWQPRQKAWSETHNSDLRRYVVLILLVDAGSGVGMVHLSCMVVRRH
jgi:hypothetical protein